MEVVEVWAPSQTLWTVSAPTHTEKHPKWVCLNYKRREAVILQRQFPSCLFAVLVAVGPPVSCSLRAADRLQVASWWRRRLFFSSNMDSEFFLPLLKWEISLWGMRWDRQVSVCLHPVWLVLDSLIGWHCVCDIVWLDVWAIMCLWWFLLLHCCLNACPNLCSWVKM